MFPERDAVDCPSSDVRVGRKPSQLNRGADFDRTREPGGTPSQIYEDNLARLGKRIKGVETDE